MENSLKNKEDVKRKMDRQMLECIDNELRRLESATDIDEYKRQILDRRKSFELIFFDFDFYIDLIRKKEKTKNNKIGRKELLNKILKDKITHKLEQVYKKAIIFGEGSEDLFDCKISQIIDRQKGIGEILDNYEECKKILQLYGNKL